jgi:hypothetical protein
MHEDNREFADVLAEAQKLGYAEADPTADVEGFDAAAKAAILSGCQNTDSGVGVYAGSHDSYYAFQDFMDKIIESYHGVKEHVKEI